MEEAIKIKKKLNLFWIIFAIAIITIILTILVGNSFAALLDNDVEVEENSELIYYLNVSYDGVDRNGSKSSDTTMSKISSGVISVEDKLPEGLEFIGFVTTKDGSIGAVKRNDDSVLCTGKVIDDTNESSVDSGVWNSNKTE